MPNDYFSFKNFTIYQDKCAMKVGTDGVLLGVLAPILDSDNKQVEHILDIGTGTGLVAIMLAQRTSGNSVIEAVEIDSDAAEQARENAKATPWHIDVYNNSIQDFSQLREKEFDLIVSNPPYFINSLKASEKSRKTARHTDSLSFEELVESAEKLLVKDGRFTVIIPYSSQEDFIGIASDRDLIAKSIVRVIPKIDKEPKRSVITFIRKLKNSDCNIIVTDLVIETENRHSYSKEFKSLTADFYLKH